MLPLMLAPPSMPAPPPMRLFLRHDAAAALLIAAYAASFVLPLRRSAAAGDSHAILYVAHVTTAPLRVFEIRE